jgi:hypothetical protein
MIQLRDSVATWGTTSFVDVLKEELARQADQLPLQQGLSESSSVVDAPVTVVVASAGEEAGAIRVKAGIFYQGIASGCSCDGDPTPVSENTEYCEVQLDINKATGATAVTLLD